MLQDTKEYDRYCDFPERKEVRMVELYTHNYAGRWVRFIQIFWQVKVEEHAAPVLCHGIKRTRYRLKIIVCLVVITCPSSTRRSKNSGVNRVRWLPRPIRLVLAVQGYQGRGQSQGEQDDGARKTALCSYGSTNVSSRLLENNQGQCLKNDCWKTRSYHVCAITSTI